MKMTENMLKEELRNLLLKVTRPELRDFIEFLLLDENCYIPGFWESPGASKKKDSQKGHHTYKGGLAYHTIMAASLGCSIVNHYYSLGLSKIDRDIVIVGILLHDIGKVGAYEIKSEDEIEKTNREKLFHHIPWGFAEIRDAIREFNAYGVSQIDNDMENHLLHIILSHHGRKSWSSPVIPQTTEAYIVHIVEFMDGMIEKYNDGKIPDQIYDH